MINGISSPMRYPGGKSKAKVRSQILAYMPKTTQELREPFVGGGGIFFGVSPAEVKRRWINDINPDLIKVYEAFRDRPEEFIRACREIKPAQPDEPTSSTKTETGKKYNTRLGEVFKSFANNQAMDQALRYYFINRTVWGGRVTYDPKLVSRLYYSNPEGWNVVARHGYLETVAAHLKNTRITCGSYQDLLREAGDDVWVYLDPPYVVDTNFSKTDKLYAYGFNEDDHVQFAHHCKNTKHKICISYDDNELVRELFKDSRFHINKHEWTYCGSSQEKKTVGKELIITNYVPHNINVDICPE